MLKVQEILRSYGSDHQKALGHLKSQYGIDAKYSVHHPHLVLFKYNQIESPMGSPVVQECRGLILEDLNWDIIAHPFHKFFNYGEGHAADIDWNTARVQEKLDGSLCTLYWYNEEWNVATSGNPDAAGQVNDYGFLFNELFWKTWAQSEFNLSHLCERYTYMFELTSPYNRVVVPHKEASLHLIGIRNLNTGLEIPVDTFSNLNPVREFPLQSFDDIMLSFTKFEGLNQEGYVVVDDNFNRVKVKHPGYVALHHMKDSLGNSRKSLVKLVVANEGEEFLSYFPEYREEFNTVHQDYLKLIDGLDTQYEIIRGDKPKVNRKDFALEANKLRIPSYLFARLDGKVEDVKTYLRQLPIDGVMKLIGYKE